MSASLIEGSSFSRQPLTVSKDDITTMKVFFKTLAIIICVSMVPLPCYADAVPYASVQTNNIDSSLSYPSTIAYYYTVGVNHFLNNRLKEAKSYFEKILAIAPDNIEAKEYVELINTELMLDEGYEKKQDVSAVLSALENNRPTSPAKKDTVIETKRIETEKGEIRYNIPKQSSQVKIIDSVSLKEVPQFNNIFSENMENYQSGSNRQTTINQSPSLIKQSDTESSVQFVNDINESISPVKISGEMRMAMGATTEETMFTKANGDYAERNFRMLFGEDKENTFDPRVYDRFRLNIDTEEKEGFNIHANITVDPWSYTGKTKKVRITDAIGVDYFDAEFKSWGPTGNIINETFYTRRGNDTVSPGEIKVKGNKTSLATVFSNTTWAQREYNIPELELKQTFQPIRELELSYSKPKYKFTVFPLAYQDKALDSDDPLGLSNHHIYWEESPWLDAWQPGHNKKGLTGTPFLRGEWDDGLSYFTRDSELLRLTALRGLSFEGNLWEGNDIKATIASPKTLWQDYSSVNTIAGAFRIKQKITEKFKLGGLYTSKLGFKERRKDATNDVFSLDTEYDLLGMKLTAQLAHSFTWQDIASEYITHKRGSAGQITLEKVIPNESGKEGAPAKLKINLSGTHMGSDFYAGLASYNLTRRDAFWGRHLTFKEPVAFIYGDTYKEMLRYNDIAAFRLGEGIDTGRNVFRFSLETNLFNNKLETLLDFRNVHQTDGEYVESVLRKEIGYKFSPKLNSKWLFLYHDMPHTLAGIDPFIYNTYTDQLLANAFIEDGKDPSLTTYAAGIEYKLADWFSLEGLYERTNDFTESLDNYPRTLMSNTDTIFQTIVQEGKNISVPNAFLYSQDYFALPPYPYFDIFKINANFTPIEKLKIRLEYTKNNYKYAGSIDDNINHLGLDLDYKFSHKWTFIFRYRYSMMIDLARQIEAGDVLYDGHHNLFSQLEYRLNKDNAFTLQWGEFAINPLISQITSSPYSGYMATLDTEHIVRLFYTQKF